MVKLLVAFLEKPYWVITLVVGAVLVLAPFVSITKDFYFDTHPPTTLIPVALGILLMVLSVTAYALSFLRISRADGAAGIDLSRVTEGIDGELWTTVGDCEIHVINGRIEDQSPAVGSAVALPCNEYFDDECASDPRSALGAYVSRVFEGQADALIALIKHECAGKLGSPIPQQKTKELRADSFGAGHCVLLRKPLGRAVPVALVSTSTQRAEIGLAGRISYLFAGMDELFKRLADAKLNEVIMPVLGAGHAGIYAPLALVGLLLAVAEAARYGEGGQRLRKVTIVVFRKDTKSSPQVDPIVVRRALALIGSKSEQP